MPHAKCTERTYLANSNKDNQNRPASEPSRWCALRAMGLARRIWYSSYSVAAELAGPALSEPLPLELLALALRPFGCAAPVSPSESESDEDPLPACAQVGASSSLPA